MRNLKKFLALVLAMMMVMGLMVTVNAANVTNFTDEDSINEDYLEAINVLSRLRVLKGQTGNKMAPKTNITRAEFATILYRLVTGDVNDEKMDAYAGWGNFTDTDPTAYYAGAIDYVQHEGLMKGNNGKFYPKAEISGVDATVALLRAVGLGGSNSYTGDGYEMDALIDAEKYGLTNVVTLKNLTKSATTREIIAQMAFNALIFVPADKDGNPGKPANHYVAGGKEFPSADEAESYWGTGQNAKTIVQHIYYPNSLAEKKFNYLHLSQEDHDDFFRPTITWVQGTNGVETTLTESLQDYYLYRASGEFTGKDGKALLKVVKNDLSKITIYYNGALVDPTKASIAFASEAEANADKTTSAAGRIGLWYDDTHGVNGYEVWVYQKGDNFDVIVREAYVAQITEPTKAGNPITMHVYEMGMFNPGAGGYWPLTTPAAIDNEYVVKTTDDEDLYNELAAYVADEKVEKEYIGVYLKAGWDAKVSPDYNDILETTKLEKKTEVITWIEDNAKKTLSNILVNDATEGGYDVNNEAMWTNGKSLWYANVVNGSTGNTRATGLGEAVLYLLGGKILLIKQEEAAAVNNIKYAYLIDYKAVSGTVAGDAWTPDYDVNTAYKLMLKLRFADGTPDAEIYWKDSTGANVTFATKAAADAVGTQLFNKLYEYDPTNPMLITLVGGDSFLAGSGISTTWAALAHPEYGVVADGITGYYVAPDAASTTNKVDIKRNRAAGVLGADTDVIFDSETVIFVAKTMSVEYQPNALVDTYKGVTDAKLAELVDSKIVNGKNTFVQYVKDNETNRVIAVLVALPGPDQQIIPPGTDNRTVFFLGWPGATLNWKYTDATHTAKIEYYNLEAVIAGELQEKGIEAAKTISRTKGSIYFGKGLATDSDGMVTGVVTSWNDLAHQVHRIEWTILNEAINIYTGVATKGDPGEVETGVLITPELKVFQYDEDKGTIEQISASKITENMIGYVDMEADGTVNALYLTIPSIP